MRRRNNFEDALAGLETLREDAARHNQEVFSQRLSGPQPGQQFRARIDQLEPDPRQPRKNFSSESLRQLAESLRAEGLLQPIVVRRGSENSYLIVAGERRFRAARLAGLTEVPCILREMDDTQALIVGLIENVHRDDLTDIEKCDALHELKEMLRDEWTTVAERVHLAPQTVKNLAALRRLAPTVQEQIRSRQLSGKKARALLPLAPSDQERLAERAVIEQLTEEQIRTEAARLKPRRKESIPNNRSTPGSTSGGFPTNPPSPPTPGPEPDPLELPKLPGLLAELAAKLDEATRLVESMGGLDPTLFRYLQDKWTLFANATAQREK